MFNIKQRNELFSTAKNSWTRMTLETRPTESTNGRAHFYIKKKVDSVEVVLLGQCCHLMDKLISVSWS